MNIGPKNSCSRNVEIDWHFPCLLFHRCPQVPHSRQDRQLGQRGLSFSRGQTRDPFHDLVDRPYMVPQSRQDCNCVVADALAFQQPLSVQRPNVDRPVWAFVGRAILPGNSARGRLSAGLRQTDPLQDSAVDQAAIDRLTEQVQPVNSRIVSVAVPFSSSFKATSYSCIAYGKGWRDRGLFLIRE
jgi:hypothetical protein